MEKEPPKTDIFNDLEKKARNGDKEAQQLLDKIYNGEEFYIGNRKYKMIDL
jgi:hypothetical protein